MVEVSADKKELQPIYLHAHELYMMNAFLEAARVGFCCLHIFQYIFKERFSILGVKDRLFAMREFEQQFKNWVQRWIVSGKGKARAEA